jgi:hypothetical protein
MFLIIAVFSGFLFYIMRDKGEIKMRKEAKLLKKERMKLAQANMHNSNEQEAS